MQKILAMVWKDTLLRFSSAAEWLFFLILPVVFTVVLAGGTGGDGESRLPLAVVDNANTALSAELIAALEQSESIYPDIMAADEAEAEFARRNLPVLLVIPAGFDTAALESGSLELELRQLPNNTNALAAAQAVQSAAARINSQAQIAASSAAAAEGIQPFASAAERQQYYEAARAAAQAALREAPSRVETVQGAAADTVEYDPRANSSAGQLITWVFIPLLGISGSFAYERQKGTLRRLLTTPTRKSTFLLGTISGAVLQGLAQMLVLVLFGIFVMRLNWGHAPAALALILASSALAAAALGTTMGTFIKTEGQASGLSIMTGMVMALLGGCWYPLELFPQVVRSATLVLPTRWAMQGLLDIVLRGQGLAAVLPEAGVLLAFAALFFTVGVLRFRYE